MTRLWMVGFTDCGRVWWRHITRRGFRHVFAITYDCDHDVWFMFDWHRGGVDLLPTSSRAASVPRAQGRT